METAIILYNYYPYAKYMIWLMALSNTNNQIRMCTSAGLHIVGTTTEFIANRGASAIWKITKCTVKSLKNITKKESRLPDYVYADIGKCGYDKSQLVNTYDINIPINNDWVLV